MLTKFKQVNAYEYPISVIPFFRKWCSTIR